MVKPEIIKPKLEELTPSTKRILERIKSKGYEPRIMYIKDHVVVHVEPKKSIDAKEIQLG